MAEEQFLKVQFISERETEISVLLVVVLFEKPQVMQIVPRQKQTAGEPARGFSTIDSQNQSAAPLPDNMAVL